MRDVTAKAVRTLPDDFRHNPAVPLETRLEFRDVRRRFGRLQVLQGISGAVSTGHVLLVLGGNGTGKSTLLRCLAGLLAPDSGTIDYHEDGTSFAVEERRRRVGYVAPDLAFYEELTVLENLELFAKLRGRSAGDARAWADRVRLPPDRPSGALSSGMRQRLRWAWALLDEPRLLLLDEPFQNFDLAGETLARELLDEHLRHGLAVVASPTPMDIPHASSITLAG